MFRSRFRAVIKVSIKIRLKIRLKTELVYKTKWFRNYLIDYCEKQVGNKIRWITVKFPLTMIPKLNKLIVLANEKDAKNPLVK